MGVNTGNDGGDRLAADDCTPAAFCASNGTGAESAVTWSDLGAPGDDTPAAGGGVIFNRNDLLNRLCGAEEAVGTVLSLFMESVSGHLAPLAEALRDGDVREVRFHAHAIAGVAANVGAERVGSVAAQMEHLARRGSLNGMPALLATLQASFMEFESLLQSKVKE